MRNNDEAYMRQALKQAEYAFSEDEVPVGAVIVNNNRVIARSYNQVEKLKDPTAHAEMIAITQAASFLQSKWLEKCRLYVTIEPCSMCAGALVLSRIDKVIFGAKDPKTGAFGSCQDINRLKLNHKIKVKNGVLQDECAAMLSEFFKKKRKK
ncbi:MAG: tRNA adenosine(34) deaminase TadA [Candidatus Omnitrophica bacterium]|nr:tRNA adenosine(34) deaminase TadA [Candidatus Omnitrophota bacterium]MBU2043689.1 tRNA adenosine(34) deaminase TadA [Candidatus Omnitrophota bacterium]MBU2250778.1 tRNA adenosine(34) deaminase TadA [Candidatus Omnitrophota bacterium]MBU2265602.1 tRNA adenosine(34) deaminase TadA [Candidatus Omnitrophota bacterium]MBU2474165.1 tRNA adenosine(34) deaminase TadA [Candidatus Omnitrophota bacterium]